MTMTLHTPHPSPQPTAQTQCPQYLSYYPSDFDETLKLGSWEHQEQIPTVKVTWYGMDIRYEVQRYICPGNIYPANISCEPEDFAGAWLPGPLAPRGISHLSNELCPSLLACL